MTQQTQTSINVEDPVREIFSRTTESYAARFQEQRTAASFCFRRRLDLAVELTRGGTGKMLDCATGTGEITAAVLDHSEFAQATIVDLSPEMLACSRSQVEARVGSRSTSQSFVLADIFRFLSASTEHYDVILCLGLIAHTGRLSELLASMKSVLAPGGRILLQTTLLEHPGTRAVRALTAERYFRNHGYRINYFRASDVEEACRRNGLFIRDVRRFSVGVPFGDKLWAAGNHWLESAMQGWAARRGSEAIYVISNRATAEEDNGL